MKSKNTHAENVAEWLPTYAETKAVMLGYFAQLELRQAIDDAVFGRFIGTNGLQYFNDHYAFFYSLHKGEKKSDWPKYLLAAREALLQKSEQLSEASNFEALNQLVTTTTQHIGHLKGMFWYDCALCIGAALGLAPEQVYIGHAGARKGAVALWGEGRVDALVANGPALGKHHFEEIDPIFEALTADQIETYLCAYHYRMP